MNVLAVCGAALVAVSAVAVIRELRPAIAPYCSAAASIIILGYVISSATPITEFLKQMDSLTSGGISVMIKALGIAVGCQLTADVCRDCGENTSASRVELAGKIGIMLLALPLVRDIVQIAGELTN